MYRQGQHDWIDSALSYPEYRQRLRENATALRAANRTTARKCRRADRLHGSIPVLLAFLLGMGTMLTLEQYRIIYLWLAK